jgi:hypothetical protein
MRRVKTRILLALLSVLLLAQPSYARGGGVDYSQSAQALHEMNVYILLIMGYVTEICFAIAALLSTYSALVLYQKVSSGEQGFTKGVLVLIGGILFMIASTYVMPAFFGIRNM